MKPSVGRDIRPWFVGAVAIATVLVVFIGAAKWVRRSADQFRGLESSTDAPPPKWQFSTHAENLGLALGADGTIYAGTDSGIVALSGSGKPLWSTRRAAVRGAPAVSSNGTIYHMTWNVLVTLDHDGAEEWEARATLGEGGPSPAVDNQGVGYVSSKGAALQAYNPGMQTLPLWIYPKPHDQWLEHRAPPEEFSRNTAPPMIAPDGNVVLPGIDWLVKLDPRQEGQEVWKIPLGDARLNPGAIADDGTIYIGNEHALFAVSGDGQVRWQVPIGIRGAPVIDNRGNIYFCSLTQIVALTAAGEPRWHYDLPARAVPEEYVCSGGLALAQDGTLYAGTSHGLEALRPDGTEKWRARLVRSVLYTRTQGFMSPLISPSGVIYVANGSGEIFALEDSGSPLMESPWPRYQHDLQNTGNSLRQPPL